MEYKTWRVTRRHGQIYNASRTEQEQHVIGTTWIIAGETVGAKAAKLAKSKQGGPRLFNRCSEMQFEHKLL